MKPMTVVDVVEAISNHRPLFYGGYQVWVSKITFIGETKIYWSKRSGQWNEDGHTTPGSFSLTLEDSKIRSSLAHKDVLQKRIREHNNDIHNLKLQIENVDREIDKLKNQPTK